MCILRLQYRLHHGPERRAPGRRGRAPAAVPYGRSKAEAEQLFRDFAAECPSCRILVVRPSVVYGPENPPETNIYRLIEAISVGRFAMFGDGNTLKTTSYIEDLIAATTFLIDQLSEGLRGNLI